MHTVLLVEDTEEAFLLVKRALGGSVKLEWARSLAEGSRALSSSSIDLVLLDVMLPDGDGYRLCSILQADDRLKHIPVMFLTSKTSTSDKVLGFTVGAEDFISKPFDPLELKARVESRLRRLSRERQDSDVLRLGDIEINKATQRVQIYESDKPVEVDLTPIEFKLLLLLSREPHRVFSRDEIMNTIWGENVHVYARSVDTHISKLRKKMLSRHGCIESVHGTGYRFALDEASRVRTKPIGESD